MKPQALGNQQSPDDAMSLLVPDYPPPRVRFGLAARLSLTLISAAALVFVAAFYYDYRESRRHMLNVTQDVIGKLNTAIANGLTMMQNDVEAVVTEVARGITAGNTGSELRHRALEALAGSQDGESVTIRMTLGNDQPAQPVLHCYRSQLQVVCENLEGADTLLAQWRRDDLRVAPSRWSEPRIAPRQHEPATFYEVPIYRPSATGPVQVGIVSAKLTLMHLSTAVDRLHPFQSGYVILLSRQGQYLSYPEYTRQDWASRGTIFDQARSRQDPQLQLIGTQMTQGNTGFMPFQSPYLNYQPAHIYFAPLPRSGWSIGVVFADHKLFAPMDALTRDILEDAAK